MLIKNPANQKKTSTRLLILQSLNEEKGTVWYIPHYRKCIAHYADQKVPEMRFVYVDTPPLIPPFLTEPFVTCVIFDFKVHLHLFIAFSHCACKKVHACNACMKTASWQNVQSESLLLRCDQESWRRHPDRVSEASDWAPTTFWLHASAAQVAKIKRV